MSEGSPVPTSDDAVRIRNVVDSLPGIAWSTDADLRIVTCHGTELDRILAGRETLCGTSLFELFQTGSAGFPAIAAHRKALTGDSCPIMFILAGRTFRGQVAPLHRQGTVTGCVTVVFDVPPVDSRCQSIADTAVDLILFLRKDGSIEDVNRTATGSPREQVIGKSIFDFTPANCHEQLRDALRSVLQSGEVTSLEVRFGRRFGEPSWQAMRIGPVRDQGEIVGFVLLASDITQRKQAVKKLEAEEELLRNLLELQDRERRLVAYEIHDGFIQDIVGARMILQGLNQSLEVADPELDRRMESAISLMGRAVDEGRRLISELRPMIIDEMGIVDAISYLISEEERRGDIEIDFTHRIEFERLQPLLQATIFRIVRESLTNARRHGGATHADIRLTQVGTQYIIVEIQDNGVGFDLVSVPRDRYGLAGIRERARLFGGGATIESSPNEGTRITVKLALDVPHKAQDAAPVAWAWTV